MNKNTTHSIIPYIQRTSGGGGCGGGGSGSSHSSGFKGMSPTKAICACLTVNTQCHIMITCSRKSHNSQMSMTCRLEG
jgi:hypothetical protein